MEQKKIRKRKKKIIKETKNEENIYSTSLETSHFINSSNNYDDLNIHNKYWKKYNQIIIICLLIIIFIKLDLFMYNLIFKIPKKNDIIIFKNETYDLSELYRKKSNITTSGKIYWENNFQINLTKIEEEIKSYENMVPTFKNKEDLYKRENPKISLIIPVHNQEKCIKKIYTCIEHQSLKDIEIIFIDDLSKDNSWEEIKKLMEIDKRISYIKNKENKGAFYSRNIGVLNSKGEYIFLVDIDDYILNEILIKSYITAKIYDLDILHFYVMAGDFKKNIFWKVLKYKSGILRGDKVINVFLYGTTRNTWDKLIKREVFVKSIKFLDKKDLDKNYVVYNDDLCIFGLFKVAKSYGFLEEIGYIYNWGVPNSTTHKYEDNKYTNDIFRSCFNLMEIFYKKTENNNVEKNSVYTFFNIKVYNAYKKYIQYLTDGFDYIIKILDLYINCEFYNKDQKKKLQNFKEQIIQVKSGNFSSF